MAQGQARAALGIPLTIRGRNFLAYLGTQLLDTKRIQPLVIDVKIRRLLNRGKG